MNMRIEIIAGLLLFSSPMNIAFAQFFAPQKITAGGANYQFSRISNGQAQFDGMGTLHLVYWSGLASTSPGSPSFIYYRNWNTQSGFSAEQSIAESVGPDGYTGGRHSSLAVTPDGGVWAVWQDFRHCTLAGNYIDNIEIYADYRPAGGDFSATDLRLSTSNSGTNGDNGYTPRIVAHPGGTLSVVWYDFTYDPAASVSDIVLKNSVGASFDTSESMAAMRATNFNDRGGGPAWLVADLSVDTSGTRHVIWGTGFDPDIAGGFGASQNLYYAVATSGTTALAATLVASGVWDFLDPAHIACAPNGDVWIAYGDQSANGGNGNRENITLQRKPAGAGAFEAPIVLVPSVARQFAPDLEIDSQGRVHIVWIDLRNGRHVYYGVYNPQSVALEFEVQITMIAATWERPTLALDADGRAHIFFEENISPTAGEIWFAQPLPSLELTTTGAHPHSWQLLK